MSELYVLPEGWEWEKLVETATIANKTVTINDKKDHHCIGLEHIESNTGKLVNFTLSNGEEIKSSKVTFEKGMVLYGKLRPYLNKVWTAEFDGIATTEILPFKPIENILDSDFLSHYLRTNYFINNAMKNISGARMPRITTKYIKNEVKIPLPSLQEQKRIVAKLDSLFAKIDQAIALHQQNMDEADALMGSVLNEVFGELEERYEKKELKDIVKIIGGGTPSKSKSSYWSNGNIKWATVGDMNVETISNTELSITESGLKNSSSNIIPKEGIVIATRVGLGKVCYLSSNTAINQDLKGLLPLSNNLDIRYLYNYLKHIGSYIISNGAGATVKGVKLDFIKSLQIPLPSLEIQQKTITYLDQLSQKTEKLKQVQQEKMQSLKDLKASLLDRAFRGEI